MCEHGGEFDDTVDVELRAEHRALSKPRLSIRFYEGEYSALKYLPRENGKTDR